MNRMREAMNAHDLDSFVACFAPDYRSEQPAHPGRAFSGRAKVGENWTAVFGGVADFHAELLTSATTADGAELGEWRWSGTFNDGSPFVMCGVTVLGVEAGQITWGRLYMEPLERDGGDIDEMVRETYRPPASG
jgi:hypothetical protein